MSTKSKAWWLIWEPGITDDEARKRFKAKFGYDAREVVHDDQGRVCAGPLKEDETGQPVRPAIAQAGGKHPQGAGFVEQEK